MLSDLAQWILDKLVWMWESIQTWALESLESLLSTLLGMIPGADIDVSQIAPYLEVVNCWVPLDFGFSLLVAYGTIELALMAYKFIRNLIPGL